MEEYSTIPPGEEEKDEEQGKKSKKKRTPGFFEAYLKYLREGKEDEPELEEDSDGLWRKIASLFRKSDALIPQPELISQNSTELPHASEADELDDRAFERVTEVSQDLERNVPERSVDQRTPDGVELIIDHNEAEADSKLNSSRHELASVKKLAPAVAEEAMSGDVVKDAPEAVGTIVERMNARPNSLGNTLLTQEYLRQRRLKRDVKRLKYNNRRQVNRQKALEVRQKELEEQLRRGLRQEKSVYQSRAERPVSHTSKPSETAPMPKSEVKANASTQTPELHPVQFKELIESKPEAAQAQDVQRRVEIAAEENVPIENLYERRHEIKDESNLKDHVSKASVTERSVARLQDSTKKVIKSIDSASVVAKDILSRTKPAQLSKDNPELYQQSIKTGFWAAVAILVLIMVASLVK